MQNYCKTIGALAAASALVAGNALAGTPAPVTAPAPASECDAFPCLDYELHVGYTSEYLFRGLNLGQDLIEAGVDIAAEWNGLELSAGAWYGSVHGTTGFGNDPEESFDELDIYAEVAKDFGWAKAAVGYIYYHYQENWAGQFIDDQQELYFSLSHDFGFVNASLTYFWDIETDNDGYSELALDRSFELTPCLDLNLATNVGYLVEQGQCTAWTTKVGVDWAFAEKAKLSPFVALSIALSDDNDTFYAGSGNELVAGSMLSVSF
jgi:uncharacterized protein (TIGR02001 family)